MIRSLANRLREVHSIRTAPGEREPHTVSVPRFSFAQASEWSEVRGAFHLLYENYREKGLIPQNRLGLRFTRFNLLPESATFYAEADGQIIATVSLIVDSEAFGLPMGDLYRAELEPLRRDGSKLAEISGLAIDPRYQEHSLTLLVHLIKLFFAYAQKLDVTDLVIACHPKHSRLYKRLFLFDDLGGYRSYGRLNDAPAVAVRLRVAEAESLYREAYDNDTFNLHTFLFTDEVFRWPDTALRAQAFTKETYQELLDLQPLLETELEGASPGLVRRLSGRAAAAWHRPADEESRRVQWELQPAFVVA